MLERLARKVTEYRKSVVITCLILTGLCGFLALNVNTNYSLSDYLPEESESTTALNLMQKEFHQIIPNERVMLRNVSVSEALDYKDKISAIDGVEMVMWLDDMANLKIPVDSLPKEMTDAYYKDGNALFQVAVAKGKELPATEEIFKLIGDHNHIDGEAATNATSQNSSVKESLNAMMILTPVIIIILLLVSSSWIEPALFLLTIGISVLINMGSNILPGEVSYITQSISPILQMAVSLDYAIFLLHCFEEQRKVIPDRNEAMVKAICQAFPSVAASAATTLFGFLALMFMRFRIGADLGLNLVKGIIFSYLAVMIFLPALTLLCCNLIDKTTHRKLIPERKGAGSILLKLRIPALILVLLLLIPCYRAQEHSDFIYGMGEANAAMKLGHDNLVINEHFGRSISTVILIPKGNKAAELLLCEDLEKMEHTTSVLSYVSTVGNTIPSEFLDEKISGNFYSENYARIIVNSDTKEEGAEAFDYVKNVRAKVSKYYDESYTTGQSAVLYDMKQVVESDTKIVNGIAILAIALVLLLTFKSLSLPVILLFIIETAIWINLAVPYFTGMSLVYIGFLVINTVQLGATIDYAIFITNNYMNNRKKSGKIQSIAKVLDNNLIAIMTSALILASAGFCLKLTSTNPIVADLGMLLGRGTILSLLMVSIVLPALLLIFDCVICRTTLRANFLKEEKQ